MPAVTTTTRPARARKPAALPYPELGDKTSPWFWLRAWAIDIAQLAALDAHISKLVPKAPAPLMHALYEARRELKSGPLTTSTSYLTRDGMLLFAWEGTTALTTEGGAA